MKRVDKEMKSTTQKTTIWRDEDIAWYAFHPNQYKTASHLLRNTLQAVNRFYSESLQVHLFTTDENEKTTLIETAGDVWRVMKGLRITPTHSGIKIGFLKLGKSTGIAISEKPDFFG